MFDKAEENKRIRTWLNKLNVYHPGWIDGDSESKTDKTADMVNHNIHYVIELKREKGDTLDNKNGNIVTLSNRLQTYFEESNRKFKKYSGYKTILLIEFKSNISIAQTAMEGIPQLHFRGGILTGASIKNKKLYSEMDSIGAVILWPAPDNRGISKACYFDNPFSLHECKVSHIDAMEIIGSKIDFLELNNR